MFTAKHQVALVTNGKPSASIVLGDKPTKSAQFAAKELQYQIKRISGAELKIKKTPIQGLLPIYVGESETLKEAGLSNEQFGEQEYAIVIRNDKIILTGKDATLYSKVNYNPDKPAGWSGLPGFWEEHGTLNAVYDFMERFCGVRYFNPTEYGTFYPKTKNLIISGSDIRRKPFFRYREVHPMSVLPERMDSVNILWDRNSKEFKEWQKIAYPKLTQEYTKPGVFKKAYRNIAYRYLLRSRHGGKLMRANHSLYGYYNYFWNKKSKNFIAYHPEWFAKGWGAGRPEQMCYTNEGLIKEVAKEADLYFNGKDITGKHPCNYHWGKDNFAVVPMDNEFHCKCPACQKLLRKKKKVNRQRDYSTDLMFTFVNRVAKLVKQTHPDKTISTLAYAGYMAPPDFPLEDNIAVHFCWENNRSPFSAECKQQKKYLLEWAKKKPGRGLYLWLYYTFPHEQAENGNYHCFPGFFAHTIGKQFKLFHDLKIKGMFHCGYGQEVESYVTFRLMDDPTLNINDLLDEYFEKLYGPAAEPMQTIYNTIEKIYVDPANHPRGATGAVVAWKYEGTPERMKYLQSLVDKAKKLAQTSPYKENVRLWEKGIWRYMVTGAQMYKEKMSAPMPDIIVPKVESAGANPDNVNWKKAAVMNKWYNFGQGTPATRNLSLKIVHDKKYLYMELTDPCDTSRLKTAAAVFPADDWEIFISRQRGMPYRQYAIGPTAKIVALSHGEINFRRNVKIENPGVMAKSMKQPDKWITRVAMPLKSVLAKPVKPGDVLYMNIMRIANKNLMKHKKPSGRFDMSSLVSYAIVHDPVRFAKLTLEK